MFRKIWPFSSYFRKKRLGEFEQTFEETARVLADRFNIDYEQELNSGDLTWPEIKEDSEEYGIVSTGATVSYNESFNHLLVDAEAAEKDGFELDHLSAAAEAMHWFRENLYVERHEKEGQVIRDLVQDPGKVPIEDVLEVESFNERQFRHASVEEFFDRLGQRAAAEEFGQTLEEWPEISIEDSADFASDDITYDDIHQYFTSPEVLLHDDEALIHDDLIHYAGYRAADLEFETAMNDPDIITKPREQIHDEYGLEELEKEYLREAFVI